MQGNSVTTVYKFFSWIARSPKLVWHLVLEFMGMAENKQIKNIQQKNSERPDPPVAIKNLFLEAAALARKRRRVKRGATRYTALGEILEVVIEKKFRWIIRE